ncbi:hypothetical protein CC1G_06933 [Coprinopsis cinerea okayama7|uniref:Uncharacterized protein n=1 Tax=Coprinopsis cinerea (strain Okayama-7 / 130 / ATCC MYA-4618 / FGSC 9003) TaxID=240176 RepID=A8NZR0_COPC7|nr:hypothetical protein CC1G_06933 [Coprinopsis cinerea okayama7\|eukprot:XP_001837727.1 hypothetical protein CC1G_06933 [Coprinopsis cinerea okayama7\
MSTTKHDDPRDSSLETPVTPPKTWYLDTGEGVATSGMFLSGLIMVTKNRFLAWPSVLFGINTLINQHPMRSKESGGSWSNLLLCVSALIASYVPVFVITRNVPAAAPPAA